MFAQVPKTDVGAMRVIMSLIVDDGVPSRGHRTNTFKNDVTHVGIANGGHFTYGGFQCFDFLTPGVNSRCDDKEEPTITCEKATEAPPPAIDMTNQSPCPGDGTWSKWPDDIQALAKSWTDTEFSRMSEGLDGVSMSSSTSLGSSGPKAHFSAKLTVNGVLSEMKCDYKMKS